MWIQESCQRFYEHDWPAMLRNPFTRGAGRSARTAISAASGTAQGHPAPGPMALQLNASGQCAAQFVAGQVVTPEFVQAQWSSAGAASNGRLQNSAMMQQPGLVIA